MEGNENQREEKQNEKRCFYAVLVGNLIHSIRLIVSHNSQNLRWVGF